MDPGQTESNPASVRSQRLATIVAAFRAGAHSYQVLGAPLYAALCGSGSGDPNVIALASHAQNGAQPVFHLLATVHYLLLRNPDDPLSQYFATLTDHPAPPERAFPEFARYCREHQDEILQLLASRTVQTTYVERCCALMPPLSRVADEAGEPLNLVEIGCSAGVLLTFDQYAYDLKDRGCIGRRDAPLTLEAHVHGGPPLRIPTIGRRIGLDLHPVDVNSKEERLWLVALSFPEYREQRARLAIALDVVASTDIRMLKGDALDLLPRVLAETPSPLCIVHSACLMYWSPEAKAALDALLTEASRGRDIYRVGIEPSDRFDSWRKGQTINPDQPRRAAKARGEVIIALYRGGTCDSRIVGQSTMSGTFKWID